MRKFGLVVAAAALVALGGTDVQAQGGGGGGRGGPGMQARMAEMMFKDITLSAEQKTKIEEIQKKYADMMPAFTPGSPPSAEDRQKRQELMAKQNEEIKAALTDEQKPVFDKNVADMAAMRRRPGA